MEVEVGVLTGTGATKLAQRGTQLARGGSYLLRGWDATQNVVHGARGVADMARNGVTVQNSLQVLGAGLATAGDFAGALGNSGSVTRQTPQYHSIYADGTLVVKGQQPPRLPRTPDPAATGAHSRIRYDTVNQRIYQLREFDTSGNPVRDIDSLLLRFQTEHPGLDIRAHLISIDS